MDILMSQNENTAIFFSIQLYTLIRCDVYNAMMIVIYNKP